MMTEAQSIASIAIAVIVVMMFIILVLNRVESHAHRNVWVHFRGGHYYVIGQAHHTENNDIFVVYRRDDDPEGTLYIRPLAMWSEYVADKDGEMVPRFEPLRDWRDRQRKKELDKCV